MAKKAVEESAKSSSKKSPEKKGSSKASASKKSSTSAKKQTKAKKPEKEGKLKKGFGKKNKQELRTVSGSLSNYPFLMAIKPRESYIFRSNDYESDGYFYTILSFFHKDGAYDDFGPFWGINLIPAGLEDDISITFVQTVERMTDGWIREHQTQAENIAQMNSTEQANQTNKTNKVKASKRESDLEIIANELQMGASYMNSSFRLQIKAPSMEQLDKALQAVERLYVDRFSTLYAMSYDGEQKPELISFLRPNAYKKGKAFQFTSIELAGQYNMVTRGIEDEYGDYVGKMYGDVNTAAILFDIDGYKHHSIVCSEQFDQTYGRNYATDLWGSKISQACLMHNHKVAHIIMNGCNLDALGPRFDTITRRLNMNVGDVNMFEMFGDYEDELTLFPMQVDKLKLMAEQAYAATDNDRSVIRGSLEEIATQYYIDQRMWHEDAANNRDKIRITGIPHREVPKLEMFCAYLDTAYKTLVNQSNRDPEKLHALSVLNLTFRNLLSNNGDLFNTTTSDIIDSVGSSRRVIYDFSALRARGMGIMMAQLLNIISFCTGNLGEGDVLIIHGTELIDDTIKDYLISLFSMLYAKGGRVCFLYNDNEKMLSDVPFSAMDKADYTIMGYMTDNCVAKYQDVLGQTIPSNLVGLITTRSDFMTFLHRDYNNVIFNRDLVLFPRRK